MVRITRRRVLVAVFAVVVAAFLLVKLVPTHGQPRIEIQSEGSDQRQTRSLLASRLDKLFPKGNGTWTLLSSPSGASASRCAAMSAPYRLARGRAFTGNYVFARWLEVRLAVYAYADAATAQNASKAGSQAAAVCEGQVVAEELQRRGYSVGKPHVFAVTKANIADEGRFRRIEIASHYKGRSYDWDFDSTSMRRGRIVLVVATATAEPFEKTNQGLARELAP